MSEAKNLMEQLEKVKEENESFSELLEESNNKIEEVLSQNTSLTEKVEALEAEKQSISEELLASESANDELRKKVEELTEEEQSLEEKVADTLNELGVEAVSQDSGLEEVNYAEQFVSIKDPFEKTKFYRKHKEKILGGNN